VQLAVFEAVNSITGDYRPYLGSIVAPHGASAKAAAFEAAYRVLSTYFPGSASTLLDPARAKSLALIPNGQAKTDGIATDDLHRTSRRAVAFQWQNITPFGIPSASAFLLDPPPALASNRYYQRAVKLAAGHPANSSR
jgi:hypothetical protein